MFDMLEVSEASLGAHVGNVRAVHSMTRLVVVTVKQSSHRLRGTATSTGLSLG